MSTATFPTLPGCKIEVTRTPTWSTKVLTSPARREQRVAFDDTVLYEFELSIEVMRQGTIGTVPFTELDTLVDFYNARQGAFDPFLFTDPADGTQRLVRFAEDKLPTKRLMLSLWECTKVRLLEVKA